MDIICINDLFESEKLAFYEQHGIVTPQKDNLYTIRLFSKNSNGEYEILLNEIINKEIPIKHKILGISYKEPAWKSTRFAKLNGDIITKEEIKNLITN
jgi:hypothetical protein